MKALRAALGEANRRYAGAPAAEQEIEAGEAATWRS